MTATTPEVEPIYIDVELHPAQLEVWNSNARFKVVACGRRFGKTFLAVNMLIAKAATKPGAICWWVAPQLRQTDVAFRFFREAMPPEYVSINHTKKTAVLWNDSIVGFMTADNPDALRSEGLDFVALDEAAFQKADVWPAAIRPALADKKGEAVLIGTFNGENWFYDLYVRGQNPEEFEEWRSWRFPSSANPFLDPAEIDEARRTTPEAEFEQEWMANPLVYVGAVFPGAHLVRSAERGASATRRTDISTFAGLDWGYTNETALEVCQEDPEGRVSWIEEHTWTATELNERCRQIVEVCRQLDIEGIWADAAGADENATLALHLSNAGLRTVVQGVPFGAPVKRGSSAGAKRTSYKEAGISTRRYYLERDLESIGPRCPKLLRDSKRYRYKEGTDDVLKQDDHTVDAATAFYATRRSSRIAMERAS